MGGAERHYSNKGGHKARSEAERTKSEFGRMFPNVPFFRGEESHIQRRQMLRNPQSGKRPNKT